MTLSPGDHVLITNDDSPDPEDEDKADVGKILHMYRNDEWDFKMDRHRAIIQWYTRSNVIVTDSKVHRNEQNLREYEVVEDSRYGNDISVETIFERCRVEMRDIYDTSPPSKQKNEARAFICRFKLERMTNRLHEVVPILACPQFVRCTPKKKTPQKTPKKTPQKTPKRAAAGPLEVESIWLVEKLSPIMDEDDGETPMKIRLKKAPSSEALTPQKLIMTRRKSILKTPNSQKLEGEERIVKKNNFAFFQFFLKICNFFMLIAG